ncbi:hypothetical protein [Viscerimonas tarda]
MRQKEQINEIRKELMQVIRDAVERENGCIGMFYKNKGCRYYDCDELEEYDDVKIAVIHNPVLDTYGGYEAATVFEIYIDDESRLMCTVNGESGDDRDEPLENVETDELIAIVEWLQNQGFVPENEANPYRCAKCGSKDIQRLAWVLPNKGNLFDGYSGNNEDSEENWCNSCNGHFEILPEDKLMKEIEAWRQKSGYQEEWDDLKAEEKIEVWNLNKEEEQ